MHLVYWRAPGRGLPRDPLGEFDAWLARYEAASVAERPGLILESGLLPLPPKRPALTSRLTKGGAPVLLIAGQEGQLYSIEQSSNLQEWKVFKLVEGLAKPVEVSVPAAPAGGTRFYRTLTP